MGTGQWSEKGLKIENSFDKKRNGGKLHRCACHAESGLSLSAPKCRFRFRNGASKQHFGFRFLLLPLSF